MISRGVVDVPSTRIVLTLSRALGLISKLSQYEQETRVWKVEWTERNRFGLQCHEALKAYTLQGVGRHVRAQLVHRSQVWPLARGGWKTTKSRERRER